MSLVTDWDTYEAKIFGVYLKAIKRTYLSNDPATVGGPETFQRGKARYHCKLLTNHKEYYNKSYRFQSHDPLIFTS